MTLNGLYGSSLGPGPSRRIFASAILLVLGMLGGCQTYTDRPWYDPLNVQMDIPKREDKQVQVTPSETSFALQFLGAQAQVSDAERRAAIGFLQRRVTEPADEIFVDFGLLNETSSLARERRIGVAGIIAVAGFEPARVRMRTNLAGIGEDEVHLTVRRYLVTLPGCPDFTSRAGRTFDNQAHSNWGCATATNFGLMVAEPRDLVMGRGGTPGDAEALVLATQRYRAGQTRELEVGDTNTAITFGMQGTSGSGGTGGSK